MRVVMIIFLFMSYGICVDIALKQGWNLIGTPTEIKGDDVINSSNSGWAYRDRVWIELNSTSVIYEGEGFWIYRQNDTNITLSDSLLQTKPTLGEGWSLVSPLNADINISREYPSVLWGWKYSESQWSLYSLNGNTYQYVPFSRVKKGEGVWLYNVANGAIGNTPILINNGSFGNVVKTNGTSVADIYNMRLPVDSVANSFTIAMRLIRKSDNAQYDYVICHDNAVTMGKKSGFLGTSDVVTPYSLSNGILTINFHNLVNYLIDYKWYTSAEIDARLRLKTTYNVQIVTSGISLSNSKMFGREEWFFDTYFMNSTSTSLEGNITID